MQGLLKKLDDLAGIETGNVSTRRLERVAFVFLILMIISAPHSIAATQTAWITGMFAWVVRLFCRPRIKLKFGALDFALWGFFGWSVISSVMSYEPATSIDRLRGTALFLIIYFVIYNLRSLRTVYFAAFMLILSCMVNVVWTPVQRLIGRGVEIHGLRPDSPLAKALLWEDDTLLAADGKKLNTPEDVAARIEENEVTKIKFYRPDFEFTVNVKRSDILPGATAMERLGIESWGKSRNWRSSGFYGHYATYAEMLQLIASLSLGLLVAGFFASCKKYADETGKFEQSRRGTYAMLFVAVAGMCLALLMTVTRASQLGFMVSTFVIFAIGTSRKWLFAALTIGLSLALIGLFILQQSRDVGFFDTKDPSTLYRITMWRDGIRLWSENPRHIVVGVGMDSIQKHWQEWDLFDKGYLPMGHFHSTPVQLLVERGLPALIIWLIVLGIYARTLWKGLKLNVSGDWRSGGILLGCLGGMIGFFTSGLVHYNLGDQEVAMVFFMLMGFGLKLTQLHNTPPDERKVAAAEVEFRIAA